MFLRVCYLQSEVGHLVSHMPNKKKKKGYFPPWNHSPVIAALVGKFFCALRCSEVCKHFTKGYSRRPTVVTSTNIAFHYDISSFLEVIKIEFTILRKQGDLDLNSKLCFLLARWSWGCYLIFISLSLLICRRDNTYMKGLLWNRIHKIPKHMGSWFSANVKWLHFRKWRTIQLTNHTTLLYSIIIMSDCTAPWFHMTRLNPVPNHRCPALYLIHSWL